MVNLIYNLFPALAALPCFRRQSDEPAIVGDFCFMEKSCCRCKALKPLESFPKSSKEKDGRSHRCKDCHNAAYRQKNPKKIRNLGDLPSEQWVPICGYEGLYEVSNMGRIKSLPASFIGKTGRRYNKTERIMRPQPDCKRGYLKVFLHKNGEAISYSVHRLVALAFIPNPNGLPEVNHKWGIKTDNRVTELEWSTQSDNAIHAYEVLGRAKPLLGKFGKDHHTSKKINQINSDGTLVKRWDSIKDIERGGVASVSAVLRCLKGRSKSNQAKGYKWEYA